MVPMTPFYKGFRGTVKKVKDHTWVLEGIVTKEGGQYHVTELPPGKWIQDFKEHLEGLIEKGTIQKYENNSSETVPDFRIWGANFDDPVKDLGLTRTIHTSNMYLIGPDGAVKKYNSPEEILNDFIDIRMDVYRKRKAYQLKELEREIQWLTEKARFIQGVITGRIQIMNVPKDRVQTQLKQMNFADEFWNKLMDIKTYQYTKEEVEGLLSLCQVKTNEKDVLKATSVTQMCKNNLKQL